MLDLHCINVQIHTTIDMEGGSIVHNYRFIKGEREQKKLVITMLDRGQTPADIENAMGINVLMPVCEDSGYQWDGSSNASNCIKRPLEEERRRILTLQCNK
jgi:hypothetical protein